MTSGPVVTRSLRAARLVVGAAVCLAPVASALLMVPEGVPRWPTFLALAVGLGARLAAPQSTAFLLVVLALGPLWQLGNGIVTGLMDMTRLMPWLAALGAWLAWPAAGAWRVTGVWQLGIVTWALVVAVTWPVTAARELDFTLQTIGVPVANGSVGMSPHVGAAFVALVAQAQLVALLLFDWAWGARPEVRRRAVLVLAPGVAVACAVAAWQQAVNPAFLSREPWISMARAAGPFYDANAMGALATLAGTALAGVRVAAIPRGVWIGAWTALSLAGVVASGSRTALAALVTSGLVAAFVGLRPRHKVAAAAALVVAAMAAMSLARGPGGAAEGHAVARLAETMRRIADGGAAAMLDVAWRRDGYGPASMAVIADHPWVGIGPGAFASVIADYGATIGLHLPPDNAQNWWRQQFADFGLIGGAASLLCSLLALGAVLRSWRDSRAAALGTAPLLALGLMACVSPPTQHPVLQALIGLLVARAVMPGVAEAAGVAGPGWRPGSGVVAWAVALTCGAGLAVTGWTSFRPPHRAARFHFVYNYGVFDTVQTPYGEGRRAAAHSVAVFAPEHRVLVVSAVLPHEDLAAAPVTVTIGDGHGVVCREQRRDHTPLECPIVIADGRWPIVEVEVSRPWFAADGAEQSALLSGRFVREP